MAKLTKAFYRRDDVVQIAQDLLGKYLLARIDGVTTGGIITETEAYQGVTDRACHAYGGRHTKRTETMYLPGGVTYVYLCYGIHSLLNVVTNAKDTPDAILIRGFRPEIGMETMLKRRNRGKVDSTLITGPGTVTQALGITCRHDALSLSGPVIWIEDRSIIVHSHQVTAGPRVGVDYAGAHAAYPWRFVADL